MQVSVYNRLRHYQVWDDTAGPSTPPYTLFVKRSPSSHERGRLRPLGVWGRTKYRSIGGLFGRLGWVEKAPDVGLVGLEWTSDSIVMAGEPGSLNLFLY